MNRQVTPNSKYALNPPPFPSTFEISIYRFTRWICGAIALLCHYTLGVSIALFP